MDVRMPDGTLIKNVPEGVTQEDLLEQYESFNTAPDEKATPSDTGLVDAFSSDKGFVDSVVHNAKTIGNAIVDPQTYKQAFNELTNFPKADVTKIGESTEGLDIALSVNPVTKLSKASSLAITGQQSPVDDVAKLIAEGVTPSIGQKIGGAVKRTEESLTSVPLLGDLIKGSQAKGIESFNAAAINRALNPIGKKLPKNIEAGHRAVDYAHSAISKAYDDILPNIKGSLDDQLSGEIRASVDEIAGQLTEQQAKQLNAIVNRNVIGKFDKSGKISGDQLKDSLSRIGKLVRQYGRSENPDHQLMSEGLESVKESLTSALQRQNPQYAEKLKNIDFGYANLIRVEKAASSAKNGVFTPAQLANAVKASDSSLRKSTVARGKSLMQDLATSGQNVLSQSVPDSGTALRLAPYLIAGGASYAGNEGFISPGTAAAIVALSAAYTRPGQAVMRGVGKTLRNNPAQRGVLAGTYDE